MAGISIVLALLLASPMPPAAGPLIIRATKNSGNAQSIAVSADGRYVAAGFGGTLKERFPQNPNGGGVFVWERETGKVVFARGEFGDVIKLGFSRDGRYLAYSRVYTPGDSIEANDTVLIDLTTGKVVKGWGGSRVSFAFSPTEDLMVVSGSETTVFDLTTLKVRRTVKVPDAWAYTFSADGKTVAALCYYWTKRNGSPKGLALFTPDREKPRFILNDESIRSAMAIAISPSGQQIVTGHTDGVAKIWSTKKPKANKRLRINTRLSIYPFFCDEGNTLVVATQPANGVSWKYDRSTSPEFKSSTKGTASNCDLYRFDVSSLKQTAHWSFEDASYRTFHPRFGKSRNHPEYNPTRFALSSDGKLLIAGCNGGCMVDWMSGKQIRTFVRGQPTDGH